MKLLKELKETDFTMLPNLLFYGATKEDKSLFQECNDYKLLLVMDYLHINTNRLGISYFTIEDIIINYGLKPNNNKGKMNEQIKNILLLLQSKELITIEEDINDIKPKELIKCIYTGFEKNKDGNYIKFTKVSYQAMDYILSYSDTQIDNYKMLFYYSYICCRMRKRDKKSNKDINCNGGVAEVAFPSYTTITDDIALKDDTIKQYNDILSELNLIKIANCGLYYYREDKNKIVRETPNFYALVNGYEDSELAYAIKLYKEKHNDRVFTNKREYKNNNKQANGYIARVNQLEKDGKATEKQLVKRDSLLGSVTKSDDTISSLKNKIRDIHKNIIELANSYSMDIDMYEEADDYFGDEYDIEDLKQILEDLNKLHNDVTSQINNDWGQEYDSDNEIDDLL